MKKILAVFNIILILIFFIGTTAVYADITEEDISIVKNPDRGLYKLVQVELQNEEENFDDFEKKIEEINENDKEVSLISLQLNLKNYVQENNISKNKLIEINKYFSIIRKNGYKVIFRIVYDSVGQANPEPEFNIILQHMEDLKEIYATNKDIIFVVEAGFLGTNGEWVNGKYDKYMTEKNKVIEKLLEIVPEEVQISFRKPIYITDYLSSKNTVTESNAFSTDIISRFGLYNSGYLESENDSDTYNKLERTESIEWQKLQTKYTSFGGVVKNWKSNYNDLENAIKDMFTRHCTYLNKNADENVMEKWKGTLYTGTEEIYNRKSGYVYIQNHLGYRLLLTNVEFNGTEAGKNAEVSINLENIGFGNILKEKTITLIYKNTSNTYKIETNIDIRKQLKDGNYVLQINEKLPDDMKDGEYNVYLSIGEPYESLKDNSDYYIKLVNKNVWNEETKGNYLGKVTIGANTNNKETSSSNIISQATNNQESTTNPKIIMGIGVGIFVIIILAIIIIIKNKKDTDLSIK